MSHADRIEKDPQYITVLLQREKELVEEIEILRKKTSNSGRQSAASKKRIRMMSRELDEAKFGMKDSDWDLYLDMSKDQATQTASEQQVELNQIRELIEKYEPKKESEPAAGGETDYQIFVNVDRIRIPELVWQPSILGLDQMGLSEAIEHTLREFTKEERIKLAKCIFTTGGNTLFPKFKERMGREICEIQPFCSEINIWSANSIVAPWSGARSFANSENFDESCITKAIYEEMGSDYLVEHFASNLHLQL